VSNEPAGKKKGRGPTGHGDPRLARILGEAAAGASKTGSSPANGTGGSPAAAAARKAIVAVGRSLLVIVWHLLSDPGARYTGLGSDFYHQRIHPERRKRAHLHQLEALGCKVTLEPAA
jgi:transposase